MLSLGTPLRTLAIARAAWEEDRARPRLPQRQHHELEFLPAAIEVLETPASPAARAIAWTIMALFVFAILWASVGKIDVVAVAQGRIVPTGRSKIVQPLEAGVVKAIHVQDGQSVRAGEVLIELDATATAADRKRLAADLTVAQLDASRRRAELSDDPEHAFAPPAEASPLEVELHRSLLASELGAYRAKLAAFDQQIAQKRADQAGVEANIVKLERILPLVEEQAQARQALAARGVYSRLSLLDTEQKTIGQEQDLAVARASRDEAVAAITSLERQRAEAEAEFRKTTLQALTDAESRVADDTQNLAKAEQRDALQRLVAPIDGVVQQLAVHTVGGVVTPAQQLLVVVPKGATLEIDASVLNRDIGFIRAGQEARIKLDAFPFTRYGTIPGRVTSISHDAVQDRSEADPRPASVTEAQGEMDHPGRKMGLVYPARLSLERTAIDVDGKPEPLRAGMAVTVEIKTDRRRLIDYLLSPLLRYRQESLHER
jgi:hemolysin D